MKKIVHVRALSGYRLDLRFDDGVCGTVYLKVTGKTPEQAFPSLRLAQELTKLDPKEERALASERLSGESQSDL